MEVVCSTGAGIITNQRAYPDPEGMGKAYFRQISIADDKFLPGFEQIAKMIHDRDDVMSLLQDVMKMQRITL